LVGARPAQSTLCYVEGVRSAQREVQGISYNRGDRSPHDSRQPDGSQTVGIRSNGAMESARSERRLPRATRLEREHCGGPVSMSSALWPERHALLLGDSDSYRPPIRLHDDPLCLERPIRRAYRLVRSRWWRASKDPITDGAARSFGAVDLSRIHSRFPDYSAVPCCGVRCRR
jgi:hypothetical protein